MFDAAPDSLTDLPLQQCPGFTRALAATGTAHRILPDATVMLQRRWGPMKVHMLSRVMVSMELLDRLRAESLRGPVILSPETLPPPGLPILPLVSPAHLTTLHLDREDADLRAGLHQKWRNRLNAAKNQGLRVTRQNMPARVDHWLIQRDAAQQRERGYQSWPPALTAAFAQESPGDAKLFAAFSGKVPVAGLLVLRHGARATLHIGHSRPLGRLSSAQNLLMWDAICWLKRKGVRRFELGLIDTEEGAGRARFKLGTGASVRRLGGTWLWWPPLTTLARPLARLDRGLMQTG
jgi:hypothetical protein